jgi:hypothetical protein
MLVKFSDSALVQRLFKKLCQLRDDLANAPFHGHEQEFAIERQLEEVFSQIPREAAVGGLSPICSETFGTANSLSSSACLTGLGNMAPMICAVV